MSRMIKVSQGAVTIIGYGDDLKAVVDVLKSNGYMVSHRGKHDAMDDYVVMITGTIEVEEND